eukprot:gene859-1082_t
MSFRLLVLRLTFTVLVLAVVVSFAHAANEITQTISCGSYTASNTQSAMNGNSKTCDFSVCGSRYVIVSTCGQCAGDTLLRVYRNSNSEPVMVGMNDNACNSLCSQVGFYTSSPDCQGYYVAQGCYRSSQCGANDVVVTVIANFTMTNAPSLSPSI